MPRFLDNNSFCENLKEVTSTKILDKKKFHPKGLFSEQIFRKILWSHWSKLKNEEGWGPMRDLISEVTGLFQIQQNSRGTGFIR